MMRLDVVGLESIIVSYTSSYSWVVCMIATSKDGEDAVT